MSLISILTDLTTRLGTEFKAVKSKISGNNTGDLSSLTTTAKTSLLAAINELVSSISGKADASLIGANSGIAPLDSGGKVPSANLPAYVDDVVEYANQAAFPGTGNSGIIYIALDTGHFFRWGGSAYVDMSSASGGLASFNGRTTSAAVPTAGDYDAFYFTETEIGDITTNLVTAFEGAL